MTIVYLVGFMGSGKSTIAKRLSQLWNETYADTDQEIERMYEKKIPDIFIEQGESAFRDYESKVLKNLNEPIIATGGGIVERKENIEWMKQNGTIIYLYASFHEISKRLKDDMNRPLWGHSLEKRKILYKKRQAMYEACADITVDTDEKDVETVIQDIMECLNKSCMYLASYREVIIKSKER
ncbi:shikimate kinase [Cerasibacillus quisquiliarum]|uniref:Shikimate kinase n=1 Tax=Cerasibacillus quisquiliarum TaxID=227865 RepID=A0A511V070_9BACI|nr:shikimate kinase [Cerasibacillus quisquiliarum]MBB5145492.1 shikimate kinase [Cerasibacillus quisquiliarum]GEN31113.1 shikimate kinase [Cerasibacillus quisquiliarum]